ncbi:hypothetical protein LQZ19_10180 [Treponema primitia]|uniref:hypothetical protein n=1 Tax=Treponema primitia TaxID=88058 RepID=UPI00397FEB0F
MKTITIKNIVPCIAAAFAVCILNYSLTFLGVKVLHLPLFLDTLFTCTIAFAIPPLPGIFIAVLSHGIASGVQYIVFSSWGSLAFILCTTAEVLLIYGFRGKLTHPANSANRGEPYSTISTASSLLLLYLLTCITISLIGGVIDWAGTVILGTGDHEALSYTFFKIGLLRNKLPLLAANIFSRIPVNIVDRFITIFGGYGLGQLLRRVLEKKKEGR